MNPERISSLCPRSVTPTKEARIQGNAPEFSGQDIAMALAHANDTGHAVLMAKFVEARNATGAQSSLFYAAYQQTVSLAIQYEWPDGPRGEHWYRNLTSLALFELLHPMRCTKCAGTRFHRDTGKPCMACDATGKFCPEPEEMAGAAKIPADDWRKFWAMAYELIYRKLARLEQSALAEFSRQLRD
jgi:hypothetical protein